MTDQRRGDMLAEVYTKDHLSYPVDISFRLDSYSRIVDQMTFDSVAGRTI